MLINIMLNLEYAELKQICKINKRVNELCKNEYFWEQKYKRDFGEKKIVISESWRDTYKFTYIEQNAKKFYKFGGLNMLTNNPNNFLQLITNIINNSYDISDQLTKIQTNLLISLSDVIYFNNRKRVKNYGNFLNSMSNLLDEYDPDNIYNLDDPRHNSRLFDYYITPEYLILDLFKRKARPIFTEHPTVGSTIDTLNIKKKRRRLL